MDYRAICLYVGKYRVNQLTVVGLAAESFWRLAFHERRGIAALVWSDVKTIQVRDVVRNGRQFKSLEVALSREDSQLALRAAIATVDAVELHGLRILDAIVPQKGGSGVSVGEHDLVCERRQCAVGKTSVEVKFRRIVAASMLQRVRVQVCGETWKLVAHVDREGQPYCKKSGFVERVCILLCWGPGPSDPFALSDWSHSYAEATSLDTQHWEVWWGWARAAGPARTLAKPQVKAQAKTAARAHAAAAGRVKAAARARRSDFECMYRKLRKVRKHGKEMRSISDLLKFAHTLKAQKAKPTIEERMPAWAKRWSWPASSWGQDEAVASGSGGGSAGYVATSAALCDFYDWVM